MSGGWLAVSVALPGVGAWAAPLALLPLLRALGLGPTPVRAAAAGWWAGVIFLAAGHAWVLGVPWGRLPWLLHPLGVALLALPVAGFAAAVACLARRGGARLAWAAAPLLWLAAETLFSLGSPWLRLGVMSAEAGPVAQAADLAGLPGLTVWAVGVSAWAAAALGSRGGARVRRAAVLAVWVILPAAYAYAPAPTGSAEGEVLRVAAVQPMVGSERRFAPRWRAANLAHLVRLSREATRGAPDLLVWPETAWERGLSAAGDPLLGSVARTLEVPLLTGGRRPVAGGAVRNSVALATPDGQSRIVGDKVWPVPVYESAPRSRPARWLAGHGLWPGRVEPGARAGWVALASRPDARIGVLVCFDVQDAALVRGLRREGARLVVALFNESEAGAWIARRNEALVRLRAIENRMPMVRVANTGRSVWFDARGHALAGLPADVAGAGAVALRPAGAAPPAVAWGAAPAWLACVLPPLLAFRPRRRRTPERAVFSPLSPTGGRIAP